MKRKAIAGLAAMALLLSIVGRTSAQDGETFDLNIWARNCDSELVEFFLHAQEGCVPGGGAFFNVTAANGDFLGNCEAEVHQSPIFASCTVEVPYGMRGFVTEDLASLPAGYVPVQNPVPFHAERADGEDYPPVFINVLQEGTVTTDLPDTGTGTTATGDKPAAIPVLASLAVLAAVGFAAGRRRSAIG